MTEANLKSKVLDDCGLSLQITVLQSFPSEKLDLFI